MNRFFILIFVIFATIFFLFRPLDVKKDDYKDIALFEIYKFTSYEFTPFGLSTLMQGDKGVRFSDRYTISKLDYTDNTKEYRANLKSNDGIYKDDVLYLNGDVLYTREDGLSFSSDEATYDKKKQLASTQKKFIAYMGKNRAIGQDLKYNNDLKTLSARDVYATYHLEDKKGKK